MGLVVLGQHGLNFFLFQVVEIDGRIIGNGQVGPVTQRVQNAYKKLTEDSGVPIPTYHET